MNSKGLQKLPPDPRDYSHHAAFGTLGASQLPTKDFTIYDQLQYTVQWGDTFYKIANKFSVSPTFMLALNPRIVNINKIYIGQVLTIPARDFSILNQLDLDFCTGFATAELQNAIWGIPVDPLYQMAKIKQISGDISGYGASLRDAVQSVIKFGSLPAKNAPYSYPGNSRDFLANYKNYPTALDLIAKQEEDLSFFAVDGLNDTFDNIRSILWQHIQERRAISFGLFWHDAWTEARGGIIPDVMPNDSDGGGHDIALIGQKTINGELYLIAQQTWGPTAGDSGHYYFPRSIINLCFREGYGAYSFSRFDKTGMTGAANLLTVIGTFFNRLMGNI